MSVVQDIDLAALTPSGRARLAEELEHLDTERLLRWFPRDADGRWPLDETVLLCPIETLQRPRLPKGSYLCACSPAKRSAPQVITLAILAEDERNLRHRWNHDRWLWDRRHARATEEQRWGVADLRLEWLRLESTASAQIELAKMPHPTAGDRAALSVALVRTGQWREALALYGIGHELDDLPYQSANATAGVDKVRWDAALAEGLADLAAWRLPLLAKTVDAKTRLFLLPGQTTTRKYCIAIRTAKQTVSLFVALTGSNARVPDLAWRWPPDLAAMIRGDLPLPERTRQRTTRDAAILAELAASPGDLDLRRVYADMLTERDNPRGEFITLQLLNDGGRIPRSQYDHARHLEHVHRARWLGPLAPLVTVGEYEGGFLSRVSLGSATTAAASWAALADPAIAHELATIRYLSIDHHAPADGIRPLLTGDRLPLLERLSIPFALAAEVRCRTKTLELRLPYQPAVQSLDALRFDFVPAPDELSFLIAVSDHLAEYAGVLFDRALRTQPLDLERISVHSTISLTLSRDAHGALSHLDVEWSGTSRKDLPRIVERTLLALPEGSLTAVHVNALLTPHERRRIMKPLLARSPGAQLTSD